MKGQQAIYCLTALFLLWSTKTHALDFKDVTWNGHKVLLVAGEIVEGDAQRLAEALTSIQPLPHKHPVVLLNSSGGSVAEALRISELFARAPVHTVVPRGAKCASACASIVFVAGKNRTVEQGGLLGQHSCSVAGVKNQKCNDVISSHALTKGVSHGSIAAFIGYAGPNDMMWFSRSRADCYGITRYPFTIESGFDKSEPCVIKAITGRMPEAQSSWRVDFKLNGYRAFLRPAADHLRELELNLFCNNEKPGILFLSMDIEGPSATIRDAVINVTLNASPINYASALFSVAQVDQEFSQVTIQIKREDVPIFLRTTNELVLTLDLKNPYKPISARTFLSSSRDALLFAANNCVNQKRSH